jgi:hypothetical protein
VDAFHSRDRERIPRILEIAKDLKCNIIRCWGGNVYEDDIFMIFVINMEDNWYNMVEPYGRVATVFRWCS